MMLPIARKTLWLNLIILVLAAAKLTPASALAIWVSSVDVSKNGDVVVTRSFPIDIVNSLTPEWFYKFRRPVIRYVETTRPLSDGHNGGQSCMDEGGPFRYTKATELGNWNILPWAENCISDPIGFKWRAEWIWSVNGFEMGSTHLEAYFYRNKNGLDNGQ